MKASASPSTCSSDLDKLQHDETKRILPDFQPSPSRSGQCFGNLCFAEIVERTREQGHPHRADKNRGFRSCAEEFESVKIFCRNPSPRPLVRPLTHLPVYTVGRLNFEPLELPANRRIFLTRYGTSMYFASAHTVSVNRQPQPFVSRAECMAPLQRQLLRHRGLPSASLCRFFVESSNRGPSAAYSGMCCAHLPSRAAGRAECLRVQRRALDLCTAANGTSPTCPA